MRILLLIHSEFAGLFVGSWYPSGHIQFYSNILYTDDSLHWIGVLLDKHLLKGYGQSDTGHDCF